tara:strand:+ start:501 stop:1106 length:606 start_codon:yes stop_codon:yes gene_type:complete
MTKIKLKVPDNWSDITVRQYQQFMKVFESSKDEKTKSLEIVAIFCGLGKQELKRMDYKDLNKVSSIILKMTEKDPSEIGVERNIKFKNINYAMIPNMSKMTTGEFVDLETYCENSVDNLHKMMSVLYRKQIGDVSRWDRYEVESYEPTQEKEESMLDLPMSYALGVLNFFFHLGDKLLTDSNSYLEKLKLNKMKAQRVREG